MNRSNYFFTLPVLIICLTCLTSLTGRQILNTYRIEGTAQGTTYMVTYYATDSLVKKAQIDHLLDKIDSSLSLYKPYSLINSFNRSERGMEVDDYFKVVFERSREIHQETEGAFDITVKPLVQAWGFGVKEGRTSPDANTISAIMECVGTEKLKFRGKVLEKEKQCIQVDFNGIAQGYSVDLMAKLLEEKGCKNYLVELGGEIRVKGRKPGGKIMAIGIEAPDDGENVAPAQKILNLKKGAITTSGNYRRFRLEGGKKISHLIDPKTGSSIQNDLISVTVYAKDAITSDGYDNALMVMGLEKAVQFVDSKKDLEAYFIYRKADNTVADSASKGFYKLLK